MTSVDVARWHAPVNAQARTKETILEIATNRTQPPSDAARQEERRRHQDPLEIQRPELSRISHPVV
jgi:hypothetical protein